MSCAAANAVTSANLVEVSITARGREADWERVVDEVTERIPPSCVHNAGKKLQFMVRQLIKAVKPNLLELLNRKKAQEGKREHAGTKTAASGPSSNAPLDGRVPFGLQEIDAEREGSNDVYTTVAEVCKNTDSRDDSQLTPMDLSWEKFQSVMVQWDDEGKIIEYDSGAGVFRESRTSPVLGRAFSVCTVGA